MIDAPSAGAARSDRRDFPRRLRLTRKADFDAVFQQGQRSTDRLFTVLYRPSQLAHARLGMTTQAKRIRTAVARNRIRRLVRESFRHGVKALPAVDVVVIVKEPAATAGNGQIARSLGAHWARLGMSTGHA